MEYLRATIGRQMVNYFFDARPLGHLTKSELLTLSLVIPDNARFMWVFD